MLEKIYRRRVPLAAVITAELARHMASLSAGTGRQIGVLISREGVITHVIVGDAKGIFIPSLENYPLGKKALRGLRLIHTHLRNEPLSEDDLTDLALLRLDLMAAIGVGEAGLLKDIYAAYILPKGGQRPVEAIAPQDFHRFELDFKEFTGSLEREIERTRGFEQSEGGERAILISVSQRPKYEQEDLMEELKELALSSDVLVLDTVIQRPKEINSKYLMGEGKLKEVIINALNLGSGLLVFNQDLSPSQIKSITELTEMKVIDRTQLILDIFARRAHSRDGKVQVELAQLKYRLPRLAGKGTAMSRLMGGIGGRGPGEMKLEVDRRRVRDRIHLLERELKSLGEARRQRKQRRSERGVPIVSIVGYTNSGKSTLLNALTGSSTFVEAKMFATLDTASRRLRFPREREVVITDTVGFIRDLPKDLMAAFKSTLEELGDAWLLIHLVDASNPRFPQHIESVKRILDDLGLSGKPTIMVFNKTDRIGSEEAANLSSRYSALTVSALDTSTFGPLLLSVEGCIWHEKFTGTEV
ncbi:MAG: GTPase HflX [Thermodesulfovibrionales bacterium]|nr:GTPase HflX [Thermodesulfovibrionales bacterium]